MMPPPHDPDEPESSVTTWLDRLHEGDPESARRIWERYFTQLVALARQHLLGVARRAADEEDVALSAFDSFFAGVQARRFPQLGDRDDLWRVLVTITHRHACELRAHERRQKRGGGQTRGDSALHAPAAADGQRGLDRMPAAEPTPAEAAEFADTIRTLLNRLPTPQLQELARMKLEGYTNDEIAAAQGCVTTTVERRLQLIRKLWDTPSQPEQ